MQPFFDQLKESLAAPDPVLAAILVVLISVWVGVAARTAAAAEQRQQSPVRYFCLALLLPGYHLILLLKEPEVSFQAAADAKPDVFTVKKMHFAKGGGTVAAPGAAAGTASAEISVTGEEKAPAPPAVPKASAFNADFFQKIQSQVTPETPWHISYGGAEIDIVGVREIMAEVVVVIIQDNASQVTRRMRVPFAKITEVTQLAGGQ